MKDVESLVRYRYLVNTAVATDFNANDDGTIARKRLLSRLCAATLRNIESPYGITQPQFGCRIGPFRGISRVRART